MQVKEVKKTYRLNMNIEPEMRRALKRLSVETDKTIKELVTEAIIELLKKHGLWEDKRLE